MLASVIAIAAVLTAALSWRRLLPMPVRLLLVLAMLAAIVWQMGMVRPGRDTGCALLAAMLAIKSSELRNLRDARSLLGFALFSPFAAFLLDQGPLTTGLAALAAVAALLALQRLALDEGHSLACRCADNCVASAACWGSACHSRWPASGCSALVHAAVGRTRASGGHTGPG